jgi:molecular chaperone DnaK
MKPEDKKELEEKLEALRKVKDSDQYDEMKKKMEELNAIAQRIGASMYQQGPSAGSGQAGSEGGGEQKKDEGPVEGEVVK